MTEKIKVILEFDGWRRYESIPYSAYCRGVVDIGFNFPVLFFDEKEFAAIEHRSLSKATFHRTDKEVFGYTIFEYRGWRVNE